MVIPPLVLFCPLALCSQPLSDESFGKVLMVFDCGHGFHQSCLPRAQMHCPVCMNKGYAYVLH